MENKTEIKNTGCGDHADVLESIRTMTHAQREELVQMLLEKYGMDLMRLLLLP